VLGAVLALGLATADRAVAAPPETFDAAAPALTKAFDAAKPERLQAYARAAKLVDVRAVDPGPRQGTRAPRAHRQVAGRRAIDPRRRAQRDRQAQQAARDDGRGHRAFNKKVRKVERRRDEQTTGSATCPPSPRARRPPRRPRRRRPARSSTRCPATSSRRS
jgi:hypothetical protein